MYVRGIFAELHYELDGVENVLICADDEIGFKCAKYQYAYSLSGKFKNKKEFDSYTNLNKNTNYGTKEPINNIADSFPFTIVSNYVLNSYLPVNYIENCSKYQDSEEWIDIDNSSWLDVIYHLNNEQYFIPLLFVSNKANGIIDLHEEEDEYMKRMEAILLLLNDEVNLIEGYTLNDIEYNVSYETCKWDNNLSKDIVNDYIEAYDKDKTSCSHFILRTLGLNDDSTSDKLVYVLRYALVRLVKTLKIRDYLKRGQMSDLSILSNIKEDSKLSKTDISLLKKRCRQLIKDKSSSTYSFFRIYSLLKKIGVDSTIIPKGPISLKGYIKFIGQKEIVDKATEGNRRLSILSQFLPPSLFTPNISFRKIQNINSDKPTITTFSRLSSGERQFALTVSTILYHAINICPSKGVRPKYRNINIVLDEMELCFHPEYQRTFLSRYIEILNNLTIRSQTKYNILLVTHSPFVLSDIPQSNILYLKDGKIVNDQISIHPFAANINEILSQSFFLERGFMGEFAQNKIRRLIDFLEKPYLEQGELNVNSSLQIIKMVGDPLLSDNLMHLYIRKFGSQDKQQIINYYQNIIDSLKKS